MAGCAALALVGYSIYCAIDEKRMERNFCVPDDEEDEYEDDSDFDEDLDEPLQATESEPIYAKEESTETAFNRG